MLNTITHYANRRLFVIFLLGFSSGLPLALTAGTLQAWYATSGVGVVTIGFLTLIGQPYIYKFLWAPLMDRYVPPFLGRRRGWMLITQIGLLFAIIAMAMFEPKTHPYVLSCLAILVATLSASQDISIDAYRTDLLPSDERGLGAALGVGGYRIAMLVSGGLALVFADFLGWKITYIVMACFMVVGMIATLIGPEPLRQSRRPASMVYAVVGPLRDLLSRNRAYAILLFILLYKLAEVVTSSSGVLTNVFLLQGLGFSLTTVGTVNKGIGLVATILGVFIGGILLTRISLYRALMNFGILQALANFAFLLLALYGKNHTLLVLTVFFDNLFTGLGTTALVTFMMSLCNPRYTATQFALLSAIAAMGRVLFGPVAGYIVDHIGWVYFFAWTFVLSIPGLLVLWMIEAEIPSTEGFGLARA